MRIPRRTIYRIKEVLERTGSTERVAGSGRPASELPRAARKHMAKAASNKVGITTRKLKLMDVTCVRKKEPFLVLLPWNDTGVSAACNQLGT